MKQQRTIPTYPNIWWRAACHCLLVIGLILAGNAAMAELTPIILKHADYVYSVTFSPDGKLLAAALPSLAFMT